MIIIPAIDIRNGNCVRLLQGDPDKETVYSNDPVEMAKKFEDQGAELIHVVDLDGAFSGDTVNKEVVIKISESIDIPIEIGGGIRTIESAKTYIDAGIKRIILGTIILNEELEELLNHYANYIIAGIDARDSMVATHGWKQVSQVKAIDVIKELQKKGINEIIYTDISTDGMMTGPNYKAIENIFENCDITLIASGGISTIDDIIKLNDYSKNDLKGCIVGKAIYDGRINLDDAITQLAKGN